MNIKYIDPFIRSMSDLFSTMLDTTIQHGEASFGKGNVRTNGVIALIGFNGAMRGTIALVFPEATAKAIAIQFLGGSVDVSDADVADSMAEMANMIAGGAKADFTQADGSPVILGLPTVMRGQGVSVDYPVGALWVDLYVECELGPFSLHITFPEMQNS